MSAANAGNKRGALDSLAMLARLGRPVGGRWPVLGCVFIALLWLGLRFVGGWQPDLNTQGSGLLVRGLVVLAPIQAAFVWAWWLDGRRRDTLIPGLLACTLLGLTVLAVVSHELRFLLFGSLLTPGRPAWLSALTHVHAVAGYTAGLVLLRAGTRIQHGSAAGRAAAASTPAVSTTAVSTTAASAAAPDGRLLLIGTLTALAMACALIAAVALLDPALGRAYPRLLVDVARARLQPPDWVDTVFYYATYLLQFVLLEKFFRGTAINALRPGLGDAAVPCVAVAYCALHLYKPPIEAAASLFGGLVLGSFSLRSGSIAVGLALHVGIAAWMEVIGHALRPVH